MDWGSNVGGIERTDVSSEEYRSGKKWSEKCFKNYRQMALFTVAIMISTITFQVTLNPPRSVIQRGIRSSDPISTSLPVPTFTSSHLHNATSFCVSFCADLMVVNGVPLKHRFVMWMISLGMNVAVM
ncbi:hypothetical protein K1719_009309 [Acacia pycnantha]|nr:hypothetical protein K1719_009309 [Acacia pycnantha]